MKIAFILSRISNLGPFVVARNIVTHISEKAGNVDVYYLKETENKLGFPVSCKKIDFLKPINFKQYDIVHSHGFVADAYVYYHRKKIAGKRLTTMHQRIAPDYAMKYNLFVGHVFEKMWCRFIRQNDVIVTLTKGLRSYYEAKLPSSSFSFIYNGINVPETMDSIPEDELSKILALKRNHKLIGVSARLIYLKGIDQVIRFLALQPNFAFVIIGDGEKRKELENQARELNVWDRCLFLGYKDSALRYFQYFDVYAMCSRSEGFGLCVIEAASQKIPVVCTDLPVYREIFEDYEVVRFEPENISSLCHAMEKALESQSALSENIYRKYTACFTAEKMADNYLNLYKKLLNQ
jgi:L-malate glycosyltransferase